MDDLEKLVAATHAGMTTGAFHTIVADWIATAKHPRWNRLYTELVYQPMLEVMRYLRANGYKVHIVTGGGQAFVRTYADRVYGTPAENVIGSSLAAQFEYDANGNAILMRPPKLLLYDDSSGKPQDIYLFLGHPPRAAFGNSTGDKQMLEYTQAGGGARFMSLVLHDDAEREYAYGPGTAQADTKFGAFTQALADEAKAKGWIVISMKNDWKRIFLFSRLTISTCFVSSRPGGVLKQLRRRALETAAGPEHSQPGAAHYSARDYTYGGDTARQHKVGHISAGTRAPGEGQRLDRHQHEDRLESHLPFDT